MKQAILFMTLCLLAPVLIHQSCSKEKEILVPESDTSVVIFNDEISAPRSKGISKPNFDSFLSKLKNRVASIETQADFVSYTIDCQQRQALATEANLLLAELLYYAELLDLMAIGISEPYAHLIFASQYNAQDPFSGSLYSRYALKHADPGQLLMDIQGYIDGNLFESIAIVNLEMIREWIVLAQESNESLLSYLSSDGSCYRLEGDETRYVKKIAERK